MIKYLISLFIVTTDKYIVLILCNILTQNIWLDLNIIKIYIPDIPNPITFAVKPWTDWLPIYTWY